MMDKITATRAEDNQDDIFVEMSCSSEEPYERWFGYEILGHGENEVDLSRLNNRAIVLYNHDRDKFVGVIEKAWLDAGKLRVKVKFAKTEHAMEIYKNIEAGILSKTSIGYQVEEMQFVKKEKETETYRVTRWQPYEVSIVTVPADDTVGVGRDYTREFITERTLTVPQEPNNNQTPLTVDLEQERARIRLEESQRASEINALARQFEKDGVTYDDLKDLSVADARALVLKKLSEKDSTKPAMPQKESGLEKKDLDKYSLSNAIRNMAEQKKGYEHEVSDQLAKRYGRESEGLIVPDEIIYRALVQKRTALTTAGATTGQTLVGEQFRPDLFEATLKAELLSGKLGALTLSGLSMNQKIPIQTGDVSAEYEGETDDAAESNMTLSSITLDPHRVGAYTDYSRQLAIQGNPSVENLVIQELMFAILKKIDWGFFHGTGTGMPTGLFNTSGITSVSLASVTFETVMKIVAAAKNQNNKNLLKFVMSPLTEYRFNVTPITVGESTMLAKDGKLGPYEIGTSTNITDGYLAFGDFSKMVNAFWGGLDIFLDPFTQKKNEKIRVYGTMYHDSVCKNVDAFVISTDVPYLSVS